MEKDMNENDLIAKEIEEERKRREMNKDKPVKIQMGQVEEARIFWMIGVGLIDVLTAWLIYSLTGYWYYALIWVVAGAGGLLWSERLKGRIGNNDEQMSLGDRGVKIAAFLVVAMALLIGTYWVLKTFPTWLFPAVEISAVSLFFFHVYQAYRYHSVDDEVVARNEEARLEEENKRRIKEAHRAARLVESRKTERGVKETYRKEHGSALDAAMGKAGTVVIPERRQDVQRLVNAVRTNVQDESNSPKSTPSNAPNQQQGTSYTLKDLQDASKKTAGQMRAEFADYPAFAAWASNQFDHISGGNMKRIWYGEINPTKPVANPNGRR